MEMIIENGFPRTQICCWTSKVRIFRIYKCAVWHGCLRGSTGWFNNRVRAQSDTTRWGWMQNSQLSISIFLNNPLSHNTLNHIVASKMQLVLFPSILSHCAYLAGWGFGWLQHLSWERWRPSCQEVSPLTTWPQADRGAMMKAAILGLEQGQPGQYHVVREMFCNNSWFSNFCYHAT